MIEACIEGRLDDVEQLLDAGTVRPSMRDDRGWSPLHYASQNGHAAIVDLLLERDYDPRIETTRDKDTPLHLACANSHTDVVLLLLDRMPEGRLRKNKSGNTPLHVACKIGCIEIVKALLEAFPDAAYRTNARGTTPFGLSVSNGHKAVTNLLLERFAGNPAKHFADFPSLFPSFDAKLSLDPPVNIFVVGDRQCGKSTLIKSLHQEGFRERFWGISFNVRGVDEHRVGVVPTDFRSRRFGRIMFYDLASGRDCIQTDFFRSQTDIAQSVFIILIDFRDEREEMEDKMVFWMQFIYNQCAKYWSPQSKPSLVLVGSFLDVQKPFRLTNTHRLLLAYNSIRSGNKELVDRFGLFRRYSLDCRKSESPSMRQLRSLLRRECERRRPAREILPSQCYVLSSVLEKELRELGGFRVPAVQLGDLFTMILEQASSPKITLFTFLPQSIKELLQLCRALQDRGRVLLLTTNSNDSDEERWIIHGLHSFATLIDNALGILRTDSPPTDLLPGRYGTHAIMTQDSLRSCLTSIPLDFQLLLQLLKFFRVGITIEPISTTNLEAEHYFPSLLPTKYTIQPWDPKDSRYSFGFAWSFVPIVDQECRFFLPHFLKLLLLRLLANRLNSDFDKYNVWSHGMHVSMHDALEAFVIVSVDSRAITLSMRCKPAYEVACLSFRNQILKEIRSVKENTQKIEVDEFVIPLDGGYFPVQQPGSGRLDKIADIRHNMLTGESPDPDRFKSLFFLEPYLFLKGLSKEQKGQLTDPKHASKAVSEEFLTALKECFGDKWQCLTEHLDVRVVETDGSTEGSEKCSADSDPLTSTEGDGSTVYGNLISCLSSISIFEADLKTVIQGGKTTMHRRTPSTGHKGFDSHCPSPPSPTRSPSSTTISSSDTPPQHGSKRSSLSADPPNSTPTSTRPQEAPGVTFSETGSLTSSHSDTTQSESASSVHSVQELQPHSYIMPKQQSDIPFIEPLQVLRCDSSGGMFSSKSHEIDVYIPEGAVNSGSSLNLEFGITLHGPFAFAKDAKMKPVSPIVWLSVQEELPFNRHIELTLPHTINCGEDTHILAFYKAQKKGRRYQFERMKPPGLGIGMGSGKVQTKLSKGPYLICIAGKATPDLVRKTNYCVIKAVPKSTDELSWKVQFCVAFFLPTCIEMVQKKLQDKYLIDPGSSVSLFQFEDLDDDKEERWPSIEIYFERTLTSRWSLTLERSNKKIEARQIDFWRLSQVEIRRIELYHFYPPRFIVAVNGRKAMTDSHAEISFTGIQPSVQEELPLLIPQAGSIEDPDLGEGSTNNSPEDSLGIFHRRELSTVSTGVPALTRTGSFLSVISEPVCGNVSPLLLHESSRREQFTREMMVPRRRSEKSSSPPPIALSRTDHMHILENHLVNVTELLDVSILRPYLRQYRVITEQEHIQLLNNREAPPNTQAELLVCMVKSKGTRGFHRFMAVLQKTSSQHPGHEDLVTLLQSDPTYMQKSHSQFFGSCHSITIFP